MSSRPRLMQVSKVAALLALAFGVVLFLAGGYFSLLPFGVFTQGARVLLTPLYAFVYRADREHVAELVRDYHVGVRPASNGTPASSWQRIEKQIPGFTLTDARDEPPPARDIPFVYEQSDAEYLRTFRETYRLADIVAGAPSEYEAMLRLGAWLGTRWDHGSDSVPGGSKVCEPVEVVADGEKGAKYWCEIAARTTVQAATALGWPARVMTASRDGYTWEHAIAEVWSNQYSKWFVMDTDFNVVYEKEGVPLSAMELSRDGEALQHSGQLTVRPIAAPKPSLPPKDMIPFYKYVHVDLRNDWCTRPLHRASPAGGDLATWWTARPALKHLLTAKTRVDDPDTFDWQLNAVALYALRATYNSGRDLVIEVGLNAYSPVFSHFEVRVDEGEWLSLNTPVYPLTVKSGEHTLAARLQTVAGFPGPVSSVQFRLAPPAAGSVN